MNGPVILLSTDLMLISTVSGAASSLGVSCESVSSASEAVAALQISASGILCLDLGQHQAAALPSTDLPPEVFRRAIAFGPHVHTQRLQEARDAGFGSVISRGQFLARLTDLLKERIELK